MDIHNKWTINKLQAMMSAGEFTSVELVQFYLRRIETVDRNGPKLNSIIEVNPEAEALADQLDQERSAGQVRGPLHGIPLVIKDNIATHDRMMTTAGSLALDGCVPESDAFLVGQLRTAGAIILGKANLSEWANFRSSRSMSGWSSRGGQTRNPYVLDRNPCGSSSGSAVAVAANLCAGAVGTETDGSIICPSQTNGIVGMKPTLGLVSRSGIVPIAHSQDTAGPMGRSVEDVAVLLGVMAGVDPRDPATQASQGKAFSDYTQFLDPKGLKGARIGVARIYFDAHPETDALIETCLDAMKKAGAELVDVSGLPAEKDLSDAEVEVLLYEFKADLDAYLASLGPDAPVHSLDEVVAFNEKNRERVMPFFGQERMLAAQKKGPLTEEAYLEALEKGRQLAGGEGIDAVMDQDRLDAIVAPSGSPAWVIDPIHGDYGAGGCTSPAAVAGYPHITVPAGLVRGLPVGLSFFGRAWSEPVLLKLAYAFEHATKARRAPKYKATLDFRL